MCAGIHLEIDQRGGEMSIYEKEGERSPVYMCISTCTLGGSGGMLPQKIFDFRLSETASGAFSGTCIKYSGTSLNGHSL